MKKAFYDCPLQAAYMAKHFGMLIKHPCGGIYTLSALLCEETDERIEKPKKYIHPDSMKLLEPQVGDLILEDGKPYYVLQQIGDNFISSQIIQRGGLPFHWPKFEEQPHD